MPSSFWCIDVALGLFATFGSAEHGPGMLNRLALEGPDIDNLATIAIAIAGPADAALVGGGRVGVVAVVDRRTAGQAARGSWWGRRYSASGPSLGSMR